jgi:hypothetical protein
LPRRGNGHHIGKTDAARKQSLKTELAKIERQIEQLLERVTETSVAAVAVRYENCIQQLNEEQVLIKERIANCGRPLKSFDESLRTSLVFSRKPL